MSKTIFKDWMPHIVEDDYVWGQTIDDVTPIEEVALTPELEVAEPKKETLIGKVGDVFKKKKKK